MSNPSKQVGTKAETAVAAYARANGFLDADREPPRGNRDRGDVRLTRNRSIIIEVKAHKTAAAGQPGEKLLATWLAQTKTEQVNASAEFGVLVVKRAGTTDPGRWWAYIPVEDFLDIVDGGAMYGPDIDGGWVCSTFRLALAVLRAAGHK